MIEDTHEYLISTYPNLLEQVNGRLYFRGVVKNFYKNSLNISFHSLGVYITPNLYDGYQEHNDNTFFFKLLLSINSTDPTRCLLLQEDLYLYDEICVVFFEYDIEIKTRTDYENGRMGYNRIAIMRRHAINNIIGDEPI